MFRLTSYILQTEHTQHKCDLFVVTYLLAAPSIITSTLCTLTSKICLLSNIQQIKDNTTLVEGVIQL